MTEEEKAESKPEQQEKVLAWGVPEAIYAPQKVFTKLVKNPKVMGSIIVLILFVAAYTAFGYTAVGKIYDEQTKPNLLQSVDAWTEDNATLWTSNGIVSVSSDSVSGVLFGNLSIQFAIQDATSMSMKLNIPEIVNCSAIDGFKNMSFRIKLSEPENLTIANAGIFMYSSPTQSFYRNFTDQLILDNNTIWENYTIPVGPGEGWISTSSDADWSNITSVQFDVTWIQNGNVTLRIDDLIFRGVYELLAAENSAYIYTFAITGFMQYVVNWAALAVLIYILSKGLAAQVTWRIVLIITGLCLIPMFFQQLVETAAYSTLPMIYRPIELFTGVQPETGLAAQNLLAQTSSVTLVDQILQFAVIIWSVILVTLATKAVSQMSYLKSLLVGITSYIAALLVTQFVLTFLGAV